MPEAVNGGGGVDGVDGSFYLEPRFDGPAEDIITAYTGSLRAVMARLRDDIESGATGRYASGTHELMLEPLATALERSAGHPDRIEQGLLSAPGPGGEALRTMFANIVNDANLAAFGEAHAKAPKASEKKFDIERGGWSLGLGQEFAEKLESAFEATKDPILGPLSKLIGLIGVLLKDLGLVGEAAEEPAVNEIAKEVEQKLDHVIDDVHTIGTNTDGLRQGQDQIKQDLDEIKQSETHIANVTDFTESRVNEIWAEVRRIESKADTLASLLGRTLTSDPWVVDPTSTAHQNKTPAKGVKEELHEIEDLLDQILQIVNQLGPITVDPIPPPPPPPPPYDPPDATPTQPKPDRLPVLQDPRLKKIFVYRQGLFRPTAAQRRRRVRIQTPAFDVSGWIDLSALRAGDAFDVEVRVNLPGANNRLYAKTRFDTPGLLAMADFCNGSASLSGDDISFVIRQAKSADGFATPVDVAYQFVVESM